MSSEIPAPDMNKAPYGPNESLLSGALKGLPDPTTPYYQQGRESIVEGFTNFFKGFHFLGDWRVWAVIAVVVILILVAIIRGR